MTIVDKGLQKKTAVKYPKSIERLIRCFSCLSGLSNKSAQKYVFEMISHWNKGAFDEFISAMHDVSEKIVQCPSCRTHVDHLPCPLCAEERKAQKCLCLVSSSKDVYAIEQTGLFHGGYVVFGPLLSPLDERGPTPQIIDLLRQRIEDEAIIEIIFIVDASVEGDATVFFFKDALADMPVLFSRLASGVPVGASLEGLDRGTLSRAFTGRQKVP